MSNDMFPDSFIKYCEENSMEETCGECGSEVKTQIMKGTGLCGELCRKQRDKEPENYRPQTDAGITNILRRPSGVDPRGIT